jgi:uncharacterized membrane protein
MVFDIILQICISLLIIFISHSLFQYVTKNYTTKKTKDLAGFQVQKYKEIMEDMQNIAVQKQPKHQHPPIRAPDYQEFIPEETQAHIQNSLVEFVKSIS